ncbi:helix-turn-helix domain-containing protein, partial [Streptomyces sp. NPDC001780]
MSSALTPLTCVAESGTPQAVSDLAEQTRLSTSTASRIAAELASCGVLIRSGRTGTYTLGARPLGLTGAAAPYLVDADHLRTAKSGQGGCTPPTASAS